MTTDTPYYFDLPRAQQPPDSDVSDSEKFLLNMIRSGLAVVAQWHVTGHMLSISSARPSLLMPDLREPDTYCEPLLLMGVPVS